MPTRQATVGSCVVGECEPQPVSRTGGPIALRAETTRTRSVGLSPRTGITCGAAALACWTVVVAAGCGIRYFAKIVLNRLGCFARGQDHLPSRVRPRSAGSYVRVQRRGQEKNACLKIFPLLEHLGCCILQTAVTPKAASSILDIYCTFCGYFLDVLPRYPESPPYVAVM